MAGTEAVDRSDDEERDEESKQTIMSHISYSQLRAELKDFLPADKTLFIA
jgi:hypothetical protein